MELTSTEAAVQQLLDLQRHLETLSKATVKINELKQRSDQHLPHLSTEENGRTAPDQYWPRRVPESARYQKLLCNMTCRYMTCPKQLLSLKNRVVLISW